MFKSYAQEPTMYIKTEAMKEAKDMSKNLVTGDFEGEYRGVKEKSKRRGTCLAAMAVSVGGLTLWLLVLTVIREVQITRLRLEVDELTANMIAMTANVKSLNAKISNNRLFNEFKNLEDTIYADGDESIPVMESRTGQKPSYESLDKLHGLTVLEEDEMPDDEDMYDGDDDDEESGDWYHDYDKRRQKIGKSDMVRLKADDFTGSSVIREIKKLLNENPENPDITLPTLPTQAAVTTEGTREKRSVFPDAVAETVDKYTSRVVAKSEERRKTKKFSSSAETTRQAKAIHSVSRIARNSDDDEGQRRPFIAAHFHGNTSHLSPEIHEQYKGNGLVRVSHGSAHDVWYPAPWTLASPHPRPTLTRNGHIHVHHTGVYLVYAQIYYLDSHDVISWVLHRTNPDTEGRDTLLQCAQSAHSSEPMEKPNSCYSSAALFLRAGDRLAVRNTGGDRHSLMQPEKSFIGLVKLADAETPDDEF